MSKATLNNYAVQTEVWVKCEDYDIRYHEHFSAFGVNVIISGRGGLEVNIGSHGDVAVIFKVLLEG